jgi:hypothetical protein
MEQVLVLNGLTGLVDTRGTGASCAQNGNGTVSCLDTPLGLAAARAADVGGPTAAFVADRLDVLAQASRGRATSEAERADGLEADALSARRIGKQGSADQLDRAAEAARLQSRAALAQSAAAAAAAQAVRVGSAEQARLAGDAAVAAAWRSDLAEVQAGALMGLGTGLSVDPTSVIALAAGNTAFVADVATFNISPSGIVAAQNGPARLTLFGSKAGEATITYTTRAGAEKTAKIVVAGMTPAQALQAGQKLWEKISNILGEPVLDIDWQDAAAIRANAGSILPVLTTLRRAARSYNVQAAETQAGYLYQIVDYIRANPQVVTLRQAALAAIPGTATAASWSRTGRECRLEGGIAFRNLWAFARDYGTFTDVAGIVAVSLVAVAGAVATVFTAGAAAPGAFAALGVTISAATATLVAGAAAAAGAAATAMANAMPTFAADPDRLVKSLGNAVCAAINENALPRRARFVSKYRVEAVTAARRFKTYMAGANVVGAPAEVRQAALAKAAEEKAKGQAALANMLGLDDPGYFTPEMNQQLADARAVLNADDALVSGGGGASASTGGGGGAIVAVGAAAAAFALWRFLR